MNKDLILEIGIEEMPARFLPKILKDLYNIAIKEFDDKVIKFKEVKTFGTPRRITLYINNIDEKQEDFRMKVIGPPSKVAFNSDNRPTKAAIKFVKFHGMDISNIKIISLEKGDYIYLDKFKKGESTRLLLPEILKKIIFSLPFPKSMKWGDWDIRFVRPIHWILSIYDGETIPIEIAGIKSNNLSYGHRFLSPSPFVVKDYFSYIEGLKDRYIILDQAERKEIINNEIKRLSEMVSGKIIDDPELIETVTYLIEYPFAILGRINHDFLNLPKDVIITVIRDVQKFFPVVDNKGKLLPYFISIINTKVNDPDVVIKGNERVLNAKLNDAKFFFNEDIKRRLENYVERLKGVIFQSKLGSYYEKSLRIKEISLYLAGKIDNNIIETVERGAMLCKADLVTSMVSEFPNLQGVMGREYAILSDEKIEVADAIYEHYLPTSSKDIIPTCNAGAIIGIADRIDTIVGCFGIGLIPSGTSDPYGLRRNTIAIINIVIGKGYHISLNALVNKGLELLENKIERDKDSIKSDIIEFFRIRLNNKLVSEGHLYDTVDAVLSVYFDDILDSVERIRALSYARSYLKFDDLIIPFKRAINIIKGFEYSEINETLFENKVEKELYEILIPIEERTNILIERRDYTGVLKEMLSLRKPIDNLFNKVMIMTEDENIRNNRISLLRRICMLFSKFADFSKISF
jgi:glycyl-tRNA synthetase beta chain